MTTCDPGCSGLYGRRARTSDGPHPSQSVPRSVGLAHAGDRGPLRAEPLGDRVVHLQAPFGFHVEGCSATTYEEAGPAGGLSLGQQAYGPSGVVADGLGDALGDAVTAVGSSSQRSTGGSSRAASRTSAYRCWAGRLSGPRSAAPYGRQAGQLDPGGEVDRVFHLPIGVEEGHGAAKAEQEPDDGCDEPPIEGRGVVVQ